jgi:hypothetical protein
MNTIATELERIRDALREPSYSLNHERLYVAQQALQWASNQTAFASPFDMIFGLHGKAPTGIPADSEDCLADLHHSLS